MEFSEKPIVVNLTGITGREGIAGRRIREAKRE